MTVFKTLANSVGFIGVALTTGAILIPSAIASTVAQHQNQ
jgi:hypothetical protein